MKTRTKPLTEWERDLLARLADGDALYRLKKDDGGYRLDLRHPDGRGALLHGGVRLFNALRGSGYIERNGSLLCWEQWTITEAGRAALELAG